jgi:hypothetical protein
MIGRWLWDVTGRAYATVSGLETLRESDRMLQRVWSVLTGRVWSMKNLSGASLFMTGR